MARPQLTAILFADRHEPRLLATLRSLEAQREVQLETLLVTDRENHRGRALVDDLASRVAVRVVDGRFETRAAARNAGAREAKGDLLLFPHPGDGLDPGYLARARGHLAEDPELALVSSWTRFETTGDSELCAPEPPSLETLLADPWALHDATVVRRQSLESAGGIDPSLQALELYDLWLRILAAGKRALLIEAPLLRQPIGPEAAARLDLEPDVHAAAFDRVFEKHRALFVQAALSTLTRKEAALTALARRHRERLARRKETQQEIEALQLEAERLGEALAKAGDPGVDWGDLRRVRPLDPDWGYSRGTPVDRVYIERFLEAHALDVQGDVLEVQEPDYTRRFGGERVKRSDVIDVAPGNARAGVIADLRSAPSIPDGRYDCVILTQTAHVVDDLRAVLAECHRILKPGGALLATFPVASRVCLEYGRDGDFWRLTEAGVRLLAGEAFGPAQVQTAVYGNVLTSTAFLYGVSAQELRPEEFDAGDPYYPLLVGLRALKAGAPLARLRGSGGGSGAVLLYHRVAHAEPDAYGLVVTPELFRRQMERLAAVCNVLPLAELVERARRDDLPPRAVAVTFDDGYLDNLTNASPVLVELGLPATFFVTGEGLGGREFWWDVLERTLLSEVPAAGELVIALRGERHAFAVATRSERSACHAALYARLLGAPTEDRDAAVAALLRWSGQRLPIEAERRPMLVAELRRLAERPGHAVGAHGFSHRALIHLDAVEKERELVEGRRAVEQALGVAPRHLAYAFGAADDASALAARAAGFELAVTCEAVAVRTATDPLRVGRFEVKAASADAFTELLDRIFARSADRVSA
jgi:peptidoglycan/xylan/chitin deacetylase (PgdA/CDA1 family)/SAM-dependent methyltransferase